MRAEIVVAVVGGILLGGALGALTSCTCTRADPGPTITRVAEGSSDASTSQPPAPPSPSTSPSPEAGDAAIDAPSTIHAVLPPLDTTCSVDSDCDYVAVSLSGLYTCCSSCGTTIGSKTWVAAVKAECARSYVALSNPCPPLGCPMGPTHARCDVGRCVPK